MYRVTRQQWTAMHQDYRGYIDGRPHMLRLTEQGGAELVPVTIADRVAPHECGHGWVRFQRPHGREVAAVCRTCRVIGPRATTEPAARAALLEAYPLARG